MAGEIVMPVVGNLTADPVLRQTADGTKVANFSIAVTPRRYDRDAGQWVDGDTTFLRCTAWRNLAEGAACLTKGARVMAIGRFSEGSYEKDGEKVRTYTLEVDELGASVMFADVTIARRGTPTPATEAPAAEPATAGAPF